jgi:hypothetical protein
VREGEPSRTAFGAAVHRAAHAELDRPVVFEDPLAWRILGVEPGPPGGGGHVVRARRR